jgi:hypothetical protein
MLRAKLTAPQQIAFPPINCQLAAKVALDARRRGRAQARAVITFLPFGQI